MCGSTRITALADTVTNSPSRAVRIDTSGAAASASCGAASAAIRTNAVRMDILTACPSGAFPRNRLVHAVALPQRQDRVAVGPRDRERRGLAPREPFVTQVLGRIERDLQGRGNDHAEHMLEV